MVKKSTYEEMMARLEELVSSMENNELGMNQLCNALEDVKALLAQCREILYRTEENVKKILESDKELTN